MCSGKGSSTGAKELSGKNVLELVVDGAIATFEPYLVPEVDPVLDSTVGSSSNSTKPNSGKLQFAQSVAGQGSYI